MKLNQRQLRSIIQRVITEAPNVRQTGRRNPVSGHGMPKNEQVRFEHRLADEIAGHLDNQIDNIIREHIDTVEMAEAINEVLTDELSMRPEKEQMFKLIDPENLVKLTIETYKKGYALNDLLYDAVSDVVQKITRE